MKKHVLLGLVIICTTGCGQGWMPFRPFRGAACRGGSPCVGAANVPPAADCNGCGSVQGYPNFEGSTFGGDHMGAEYYGGNSLHGSEVIHDSGLGGSGFQSRGTVIAPPMQSIPAN